MTFSLSLYLKEWMKSQQRQVVKANALGTVFLVGMRQIAAAILLRLSFEGRAEAVKNIYLSHRVKLEKYFEAGFVTML